ncbi:MAG: pyridoxal 5'-phosphate synthase glutaminase subunit PdxT [Actinomycetota bacterium]
MKVGVLGLQGDVREHVSALEAAGTTPTIIRTASELADVGALVIPGGESTTIGKLMDRFGLVGAVVDRARAGMPVYGTCAGMILMARDVVGRHDAPHLLRIMDLTVHRNAYGRQVESFEADLAVTGMDDAFPAVFIRAPVVESVGPRVEVLATWDETPVLVRQGRLLASSFHPEISGDARIHELFVRMAEAC